MMSERILQCAHSPRVRDVDIDGLQGRSFPSTNARLSIGETVDGVERCNVGGAEHTAVVIV